MQEDGNETLSLSVCVSCIILAAPWRAFRTEMKPDTLIEHTHKRMF